MNSKQNLKTLFQNHSRKWEDHLYVYPVISRRAKGLSIGINLCPENFCNFACVYCSVLERHQGMKSKPIDLNRLEFELYNILSLLETGEFWASQIQQNESGGKIETNPFAKTPLEWKVLKDITFAGNGEPTTSPSFEQSLSLVSKIRQEKCPQAKLILLSNASLFSQSKIQTILKNFFGPQGIESGQKNEIWAKLDAGTENGLKRINRSRIKLSQILHNIQTIGAFTPIVIQSMFCRFQSQEMDETEFLAWLNCIEDLLKNGTQIAQVQIYTLARETSMPHWNPVPYSWLKTMEIQFRKRFPFVNLHVVY